MTNDAKIVNVFIASPGDLKDERDKLADFLENYRVIEGVRFDPKRWEIDIPATKLENGMDAQEYIDSYLVDCDITIIMFKSKFGSETRNFSSGTEEEFYISLANKMRVIVYYFDHHISTNCSQEEADNFNLIRGFKNRTQKFVFSRDVADIKTLLSSRMIDRDLQYNIDRLFSSSNYKASGDQGNAGSDFLPDSFVKIIHGKPTILWDDYVSLIKKLDYMLRKSQSEGGFAFDVIVAVNKCGLITGTLLGRLQGNSKQVFCIFSDSRGNFGVSENRGTFLSNTYVINAIKDNTSIKNILVVDTINRHTDKVARAFRFASNKLRGAGRQIKTAVLINNRRAAPLDCDYIVYNFDGDNVQLPYNSVLEGD